VGIGGREGGWRVDEEEEERGGRVGREGKEYPPLWQCVFSFLLLVLLLLLLLHGRQCRSGRLGKGGLVKEGEKAEGTEALCAKYQTG